MTKKIDNNKIDKLVPDTSVIIEGMVSRKIKAGEIKPTVVLIHEAVIAELEHQANMNKTIGFLGLDEIKHLKELSGQFGFELNFAGVRPSASEIRHARLGEIDALIRQLAFETDGALLTADKVQAEVARAKDIPVIFVEVEQLQHTIRLEKYFDDSTMSVHLRENVVPKSKKGVPGNWSLGEIADKPLSRDELKEISREIIEEAGIRKDGFVEIERPGSTIVQLGPYRIVITRPPLSDGWEITAVRPVKKLSLDDYKLSDKLKHRIKEQAEGILIAGAPGMGKCLPGNEIVYTEDFMPVTVKRCYEENITEILGIDELGAVKKQMITQRAKRLDTGLLKLTTRSGRVITVTPRHPLLTFAGKLEWKEAKDFKVGEKIAVVRNVRLEGNDELDVLGYYDAFRTLCRLKDLPKQELQYWYKYRGIKRDIIKILFHVEGSKADEIAHKLNASLKYVQEVVRLLINYDAIEKKDGRLNLKQKYFTASNDEILLLSDLTELNISSSNIDEIAAYVPNNGKINYIKIPKKVTPELCKFLGYIYSEGGGDKLCFTNSNRKLVDDFMDASRKVFGIEKWKTHGLTYYLDWSKTFQPILSKWGYPLKQRKKSRIIVLPGFLMHCSIPNLGEFLRAYFDGDGGVEKNGRSIEYYTSSDMAAQQLSLLLLRIGVFSSVKAKFAAGANRYTVRITDRRSMKAFCENIKLLDEVKSGKLNQCLAKPYSQIFCYDIRTALAPIRRFFVEDIKKIKPSVSIELLPKILRILYEKNFSYVSRTENVMLTLKEYLDRLEGMESIYAQNADRLTYSHLMKNEMDHNSLKHWARGRRQKISTLNKLVASLGYDFAVSPMKLSFLVKSIINANRISITQVSGLVGTNQATLSLRLQNGWDTRKDQLMLLYKSTYAEFMQTKKDFEAAITTIEILCKSDVIFDSIVKVETLNEETEVYDFETSSHNFIAGKLPVIVHNSTFAQALAEHYAGQGKVVKTVEAPRDLILPDNVTQYAISHGTPQEIHDILLLSRPDYTIFDEMRNTADFQLFADLRLAGIGLAGVVHATNPIDAIQRFVGRIELGVIPQIVDTVIFIRNGFISKVLSLNMTVKVPEGMTEADLSRPVVVVNDFETGKLEYELYSYGEETVVIPVRGLGKSPIQQFAALALEARMKEYASNAKVEMVSDSKCVVYVPEKEIPRLIGKDGRNIAAIEEKLGVSIDVQALGSKSSADSAGGSSVPFNARIGKKHIEFNVDNSLSGKNVNIMVDDDYVMTANVGKDGVFKISRKNKIGSVITDAVSSGTGIKVTASNSAQLS